MTDKEAQRFLAGALLLALAAVMLLIFGCTIVIGDSNKVEQEVNTDSKLRGRLSVEDSANAKADTKADNRVVPP